MLKRLGVDAPGGAAGPTLSSPSSLTLFLSAFTGIGLVLVEIWLCVATFDWALIGVLQFGEIIDFTAAALVVLAALWASWQFCRIAIAAEREMWMESHRTH